MMQIAHPQSNFQRVTPLPILLPSQIYLSGHGNKLKNLFPSLKDRFYGFSDLIRIKIEVSRTRPCKSVYLLRASEH